MRIFSKEAFHWKEQLFQLKKIQNIAACGMFIALYIILSYFSIRITESIEIRFGFLALAMAGCFGGPVMGLTVGAVSDILKMVATAGGGQVFFFGFTISYALLGFLFGICFYKNKINPISVGAASIGNFLVGISLNTYWLHLMYGMPLGPLAKARLIKEVVTLPLNFLMLFLCMRALLQVLTKSGVWQRRSA